MIIQRVSAKELTPALAACWAEIQRANPTLDSPFFRPEFARAVADVRDDVEVAVLRESDEAVGFFPFQRKRWGAGKPVGGPMSDFQGVIAGPDVRYTAEQLMRACRLAAWDFDHLLCSQQVFAGHHRLTTISPYLDLRGGFDAYEKALDTSLFKKLLRKRRKLERDVAPVRFEFHPSTQDKLFDIVIDWKTKQYISTQATNVFAYPWTTALLKRLIAEPRDDLRALTSALYVGDQVAAVHLWLRSGSVLHAWFPAYDPQFSAASPGLLLLEDAARAAESQGITRIDLGRGTNDFKQWFMSASFDVAEGTVACNPLARTWRQTWHSTRQRLKESRLKGSVEMVGRWTRPLRSWLSFH